MLKNLKWHILGQITHLAFNTAQVILGKKLVSLGRSNPFDYKGKTNKIREITKEMREIAREINPTKREVRREVRR